MQIWAHARCPQRGRNIREDPADIREVNDHFGRYPEKKLKDPAASVCPCCPQGVRDIREVTTDIREIGDHTDTDLATTNQGGPDQHQSGPDPKWISAKIHGLG